jgi:hypothetical protein
MDKPTHPRNFTVRLYKKDGTALPVGTLGMLMGVHMWDSVGRTLIRNVYRVYGGENPNNPLYQLVAPWTPLHIVSLATPGSGVPVNPQ